MLPLPPPVIVMLPFVEVTVPVFWIYTPREACTLPALPEMLIVPFTVVTLALEPEITTPSQSLAEPLPVADGFKPLSETLAVPVPSMVAPFSTKTP